MGLNLYQKTSVYTASKEELLLLLYEMAIKDCKRTKLAIQNKDIAAKVKSVGHLQDVILELMSSLKRDGSELSNQLLSLYDFIMLHSTKANLENDDHKIDDCLAVLNILYAAWKEAVAAVK